jgi:hypothetical protein
VVKKRPIRLVIDQIEPHENAFPSTLLAQVCYVVLDAAIESFLNMESDVLKAELQQNLHAS